MPVCGGYGLRVFTLCALLASCAFPVAAAENGPVMVVAGGAGATTAGGGAVIPPRGVSGSPTLLAGTVPSRGRSATVLAQRQGTPLDVSLYSHWSGNADIADRFATIVARDSTEWTSMWARVGGKPPLPLPREHIAVAILPGLRPGPGYNVRITEMRLVDDGLQITYLETKPTTIASPGKGTAATGPWVIKLAPRVEGRIRFFQAKAE